MNPNNDQANSQFQNQQQAPQAQTIQPEKSHITLQDATQAAVAVGVFAGLINSIKDIFKKK